MTKGTQAQGKRGNKSHTLSRFSGKQNWHKQKKRDASTGSPSGKIRRYNWATKTKRRTGQGTGRMRNEFNSQLTRRESICDWEHERRATTDGVRKDSLLASGGVSAFTGCDYSMPSAALLRKLSTPLEAKLRGRRSVLHSCAAAN